MQTSNLGLRAVVWVPCVAAVMVHVAPSRMV